MNKLLYNLLMIQKLLIYLSYRSNEDEQTGKLAKLKALLVGALTDICDSTVPFGMTYKEIIFEKVKEYEYPG